MNTWKKVGILQILIGFAVFFSSMFMLLTVPTVNELGSEVWYQLNGLALLGFILLGPASIIHGGIILLFSGGNKNN